MVKSQRFRNGLGITRFAVFYFVCVALSTGCSTLKAAGPGSQRCAAGTVHADVVALDQPIFLNRLGSYIPGGMMFALASDVVPAQGAALQPGGVVLRHGKRPRPLVLRVNQSQCLDVTLTNYLSPTPSGVPVNTRSVNTRSVGLHVDGLEWRASAADDGTFVGTNQNSQVVPGASATYRLYAAEQGTFLLYSFAAPVGAAPGFFPVGGQLSKGLFGAVNVQPQGAEWYRSQVTQADLALAAPTDVAPGLPKIEYDAVYPTDPQYGALAGKPILKMLDDAGNIVHSDLTAIITGPDRGDFTGKSGTFARVEASPDRRQAYREITVIYHELTDYVTQAFDSYYNPPQGVATDAHLLSKMLTNGADAFAINYGSSGIANEILANRFGVGPMHECADCKFEEFFLSAWAVGDPAMVVDDPTWTAGGAANGKLHEDAIVPYPDDPSNVFHSYLWDHVKFRVLHGGASLHHLHHQHAQQWLHSPDADDGHYLDSQAIGPGSGFTLEMVYNGSGNKNLTVGDSIFHCHFYPHFAAGMWGLWRSHDVFEAGTPLRNGRPVGRALPDGEIRAGTPIPAVVPVPNRPMAPAPAAVRIADGQVDRNIWPDGKPPKNPGFPFYIPGIAGSRAPHPPLDLAFDGGLPRHIVVAEGNVTTERHTYQNFEKDAQQLNARQLDELGEPAERVAMEFHAQRNHPSFTPEGARATFTANGLKPVHGAPYADPCVDIYGHPSGESRVFKAANLQHDVVLSKEGWHFPQLRMIALWEDVVPTLRNERPAQPFFFRANSDDCIVYMHTNLVPDYYQLDDFQVRTPTDILGQHIHLVKFDVTSSDGAANGWNYEDGAFSPQEVQSRIAAINAAGGLLQMDGLRVPLSAATHPYFGQFPAYRGEWLGAQTEYQRWYADPLLNVHKKDRTLRTVFTHDHFSPSTHQQAGLYAGLLVEPKGSTWWEPATNEQLGPRLRNPSGQPVAGNRIDGGPTSWQANIETAVEGGAGSYREFGLAFQDFQLAYRAGFGYPTGTVGAADHFQYGSDKLNYQNSLGPPTTVCENNVFQPCTTPATACDFAHLPCPQLISTFIPPTSIWDGGLGMTSLNYRAEPLAARMAGTGGAPHSGDAAYLFTSISRAFAGPAPYNTLNTQTPPAGAPGISGQSPLKPLPALTAGMRKEDPYTPLLRSYMGDKVEIATLAGAHLEVKNFTIHGLRWLFEDPYTNSGYRNSQTMGLSEHFEFDFTVPTVKQATADHVYMAGAATSDLAAGNWGLLRAYRDRQDHLRPLPNNNPGSTDPLPVCAPDAPLREFKVWAVDAKTLIGSEITYAKVGGGKNALTLNSNGALLYVLAAERYQGQPLGGDVDLGAATPTLLDSIRHPYPLVLRARAGDCIEVMLSNRINVDTVVEALAKFPKGSPPTKDTIGSAQGAEVVKTADVAFDITKVSFDVGLHPQLVALDVNTSDGFNAGVNPPQTAAPGDTVSYRWYAGKREMDDGAPRWTPMEFGAANLMPADPLYQQPLGLGGALIIEPAGATWRADAGDRTSATVTAGGTRFREFVVITWNDLMLWPSFGSNCGPFQVAINYRSAPLAMRDPALTSGGPPCPFNANDISGVLANAAVSGADTTGPIFSASAGDAVRFRLLSPGNTSQNEIFSLSGHVWQEEPYMDDSRKIGVNRLSNQFGAWAGHGAGNHYDVVISNAGGSNHVPGDYLLKTMNMADYPQGMWGIFRVTSKSAY